MTAANIILVIAFILALLAGVWTGPGTWGLQLHLGWLSLALFFLVAILERYRRGP